jgi:very-short-patch-repair endonuclease
MLSLTDTIRRRGGIARGRDLQRLGFTRSSLARAVRGGTVERLRDGVFAAGPIEPDVRAAVAHGGALTCASVLTALQLWVLPPITGPHVWLGAGRHAHPHPGCVCVPHYYRGTPPLGRVDLETALLHLRLCSGDEAFFAAFESAWRHGHLDTAARRRIRSALPATARWLTDLARGDADSGLESLLRLRLHLLGLRLECQVRIDGVGVVDFVIDRVIIEVDGKANHQGVAQRHKDLVRDAAAARRGYRTLRFDYAQVVYDWPSVQAAILAALGG